MKRVLIIQDVLKQYRLAFFEFLYDALQADDIELTVAFSLPDSKERSKQDNSLVAPKAFYQTVQVFRLGKLTWQRVGGLGDYDLVIVEQANRHLLTYCLLARRRLLGNPKVAWWGHGHNHQSRQGGWREKFKAAMLTQADWFFAYTDKVAAAVEKAGMPASCISSVNNSIDSDEFSRQVRSYRQTGVQQTGTLLFCGALYQNKRLDLLLDAAEQLYNRGVIRRLIVLGAGPLETLLTPRSWLDYRGACFGQDKAKAYAEASLVLNPGLTGLAILDAFAAGLPYITCDLPYHSPEIAYLKPELNGLLVAPTTTALTNAVTAILTSPDTYQQYAKGAQESGGRYGMAAMVERFAQGIRDCLQKGVVK
ncbi:glycosyltransferase family 4 protein [Bowmanella pacifica]|uniref:Uncharacterized protein n=1 Tax=Bowmanella pacifica TaxID=502051 RepID=A0A917YRC7_9ALTE|nr:glycosyltransferase family 4 protein [Bowmanella pacifica]GGO64769.1 hypothetical protein GCM10010982_04990 [Bowmanella pacifica]